MVLYKTLEVSLEAKKVYNLAQKSYIYIQAFRVAFL